MRKVMIFLVLTLLMTCVTAAHAATEVKMTGDAIIYGLFNANRNFTGWNPGSWTSDGLTYRPAGTQTEDRFQVWERFRLRTDFVASESVKFRLGIKVEDTWGHGTFTAANPSNSSIAVYQAYLQFKLPDCDVEVTAGLQDLSLPQSSFFTDSVVFGGDRAAALVVTSPLIGENLKLLVGMARLLDKNQSYDATTTQIADECDVYFLTLPITFEGFKATPWAAVASAGLYANYFTAGSYGTSNMGENLVSAGIFSSPTLWSHQQNAYWWAGSAFEITALDPVKFYADVIHGEGAMADRSKSARHGWFIDAGAEYTGWGFVTPQVFGWWSTGEDGSTRNGSERMPIALSNWGPGNSFLFDCSQELLKGGNVGVTPVGNWGFGASLNNISLIEKLTNRLTFTYVHGNNSAKAIRDLNAVLGSGNPYFTMGHDLTVNEHVFGANFDTKYMIYENLAAILETGWAHGDFQKSVWGRRLANRAQAGDTWKTAIGLKYTF
jgi:hypothetical protein